MTADEPTVFQDGAFRPDRWVLLPAGEAPSAQEPSVVGKGRFLADRDALLAHEGPLGLLIEAGEDLDGVEPDLGRFSMIALRFPKYTDGRAYSMAALLRSRHRFAGELRAV